MDGPNNLNNGKASEAQQRQAHFSDWNGLLWNDYLNCDASGAQEVLQAERDELAEFSARRSGTVKAGEAQLPEAVRKQTSTNGQPKNENPSVAADKKANDTPTKDDPYEEGEEVWSDAEETLITDCIESSLAREEAFKTLKTPGPAESTKAPETAEKPPAKTETKTHCAMSCGKPLHECHCRKHELMHEAESPGEEVHLNLHPRRKSLHES